LAGDVPPVRSAWQPARQRVATMMTRVAFMCGSV
jgi:hypothetical protein